MIQGHNYPGNIDKISSYLKDYGIGIDHTSIWITVKCGNWWGPFGYANRARNLVESRVPVWLFWCRDWASAKIIYHEWMHLQGVDECLSGWFISLFCTMYESKERWKELAVKPLQLLRGFTACRKCKEYLSKLST